MSDYDRKTWWIEKLRDAHLAREVAIAALKSCGVEEPLKLIERISNE